MRNFTLSLYLIEETLTSIKFLYNILLSLDSESDNIL